LFAYFYHYGEDEYTNTRTTFMATGDQFPGPIIDDRSLLWLSRSSSSLGLNRCVLYSFDQVNMHRWAL